MEIKISNQLRLQFMECVKITNITERQLAIGSIITEAFTKNGLLEPIIVGGTVVSLYSTGQYSTVDLDMKSEAVEEYHQIMTEFGYKKFGKDFYHKDLDSYVEFPSGRLEDSWDHIREVIVDSTGLPIYVIGFEDIVLDRLSHFASNGDRNSREWAMRLMGGLYDGIDWSYLHSKAKQLGILEIVEKAQRDVKRYKQLYRSGKMNEFGG